MRSMKYHLVKDYYDRGLWSKTRVKNAVKKGWITAEEYDWIINGEPVEEPEAEPEEAPAEEPEPEQKQEKAESTGEENHEGEA